MRENPLVDGEIVLRCVEKEDLTELYELIYSEDVPEWKQWDAPYYALEHESYEDFERSMLRRLEATQSNADPDSIRIIELNGRIVGTISYYWEHRPSMWLEMGIVLYRSAQWGHGIGTRVLQIWSSYLFEQLPLARVGLTTWSGNERMMRSASKAGLQVEGRMRKCRIVDGKYYDSIRMGMLREEWEQIRSSGADRNVNK
ncbi:GNAT family protein [Paenibacillus taichungensis]|uniref:GNAT family N-acetyltransferase n=1 Tax=Paenibacillus taichungensis TaxID=484184 RepID=UPI002DB6D714|nr:GNAT family protein [Paenibacillus taichungensis]MEC0110501.1 GNAT family protein [Paenibacillus taichungensis]MEC0197783.1 GNAT family protein [Paenibacillus taichungensis]